MDILDWLQQERDRRVAAREPSAGTMTAPDDGSAAYLFEAYIEIKKSRERIATFTKVLKERGHEPATETSAPKNGRSGNSTGP